MPFCPSCGAEVAGTFCAKCGSAVPGAAPAGGAVPPPQGGYQPQPAAAGMADNVAGMLCYIAGFITGIIFLVIEPYNKKPNIRFHAFQSIFLNVAVIVIEIVFGIVLGILMRIIGLFGVLALFYPLFGLLCVLLWLYLLISTYQGKTVVLPIIGPLAQKQAGM